MQKKEWEWIMIKITCFIDEASLDFEEQLAVLEQEGLRYMEIRKVWGKNVLDLTQEELQRIRSELQERNIRVSSIGSPIGKYMITDDFAPQLEALERAMETAYFFETPFIRIFSFRTPKGEPLEKFRDEVLRRMNSLTQAAKQRDIILLLENDSNLYGNNDVRCLEILSHCNSPHLRAAFDPGNYVMNQVRPMTDAYSKVSSFIEYIHIKDAITEPRMYMPAGMGEGEIPALLEQLKQRGYEGYLSVEPHLEHYLPDASNPERVVAAIGALKQLLKDADWVWE
jgi:sugar phosphate isomerase/epimerase